MLSALYFVQGLPFGFQATALPVLLREGGASLTVVGFAGALALPWLLKPLWAPLVDRYHWPSLGRRRSWLLPMQALLALAAVAAGLWGDRLVVLMAIVLVMNLFAATLDIAVDGLAIDVLSRRDLGVGNTAQVVGYKLGMLTGGGLLMWATALIGQRHSMFIMAALICVVLFASWRFREPMHSDPTSGPAIASVSQVLASLLRALRASGGGWLLLVVASYKLGESMSDAMFKPFVLDAGFSKAQIGLWLGTWGMLFSITGSAAGGLLATRWSLLPALRLVAVARVVPLAAQWWLATRVEVHADAIIVITCAEHLFGGALTTVMFALMMSRVDKRIGATHYTALAAIEVLGKMPSAWLSGTVAQHAGYAALFALATIISLAFLALLPGLAKERPSDTGSPAG
jgi:PAT family beta-lactamase induction signal transducer AmpG